MTGAMTNLEVVEDVERIVLAHLPRRLADAKLAEAVGVNVGEMRRAFLDVRGAAMYQALYKLRLELVERILKNDPTRSPEVVAFQCGFGHYGVFHRRYRHFLALRQDKVDAAQADNISSAPGAAVGPGVAP